MTKKDLEDYLWGAANILGGVIDAADFKQYIFPLLFFKRISDVGMKSIKYGQELNLITSAITRINMFMHNIDEFLIVQGDSLDKPQILENDELKW